jgi:hypothetical protein
MQLARPLAWALLAVLLASSVVGDPTIAFERRRRLQKQMKEQRSRDWARQWSSTPRRRTETQCDVAGACVRLGVQVVMQDGAGLVFCHDCYSPDSEGAYGTRELFAPTKAHW